MKAGNDAGKRGRRANGGNAGKRMAGQIRSRLAILRSTTGAVAQYWR
jgi:hypothetical protein